MSGGPLSSVAAYLGEELSNKLGYQSECDCRTLMKALASGKFKFTDFVGTKDQWDKLIPGEYSIWDDRDGDLARDLISGLMTRFGWTEGTSDTTNMGD